MLSIFTLKRIFQIIICISFSMNLSAQITFVNPSATGDNDGSSWENAYTDLQNAFDNTTEGAIWVKTGTYVPGGTTEGYDLTFDVSGTVQIFGGFAGTEASAEDRDIAANPTILSGDVAGDDTAEDFSIAKEDNRRHVLVVDTAATDIVVVFNGQGFS